MIELESVLNVIENAGLIFDKGTFDPNKSFKDNGIDSLDVMNLFLAVEEAFHVKFTEDEAEAIDTANKLVAALNQR